MRGLKYFAEYSNIDGQLGRIEIWVEGYAGAATEVVCGGDPLIIERNKQVSETYLGGIVPTFYKFQFVSAAAFSASSFSSENYGDVIIRHLRAGVLEFNAIVAPFVSFDEDLPATYSTFTLQSECGIKYLSNIKIGATLTEVRLIDLVTEAMALIPRVDNFPFKVVDNTKVFTTAGLVLDGLPFFDRLINKRTFEGLTWTQVLEQVIANRCEIVLDAGAWWVRNLSELSELYSAPSITTNLVNYSASGVKGETIPYRPGITGTRLAGGQFGSLFSQKNIRISRKETARIEYVPNSNFKGPVINFLPQGWTTGPTGLSTVIDNAEGYLQIQGGVNSLELTTPDTAYIQSSPVFWEPTRGVIPGDKLFLKIISEFSLVDRLRLQIIAIQASGEPQPISFYLTSAGAWTTTPTIYFANGSNAGSAGNVELELTPPAPFREFGSSANYNVIIRLFRSEGSSLGHTRFREVSLTKDPVMQSVFDDFFTTKDFRADPNADRSNSEDVDTLIAPDTGFPYREGSILISQGVAANAFTSAFDGVGVRKLYDDYLAVSYLSVTGKRLRTYDGEFYNELHFSDVVQIDQIFYRFYNFSENRRSKRIRCKVVELKYVDFSTLQKDTIKTETAKVIERVIQSNNLIPSDFNFNSAVDTSGKTLFGIRPDTRFTSTNVTSLFLRADVDDEEAGVEITPGAQPIGLTTPPPIVPGVSEIIATRQWANTAFQPLDADLTALAGLNTVGVIRRTGAGAMSTMAGTLNRVVKWGANGELVNTIIRETGSAVVVGADAAINSVFEVISAGINIARFQNSLATGQTIVRVANDSNTALAIQAYGSAFVGGSVFSVGANGVAISQQANGPLALGTFGVSQPIIFGTNAVEAMRINPARRVLIGTTTDAGELLQVQGTARIATSLTTPIIGNPAGVTANNTWTFSAPVNIPLTPTASAHATSKQYVDNLVATGIKEGDPVRTISLTNITLSGIQTVSGVALVAGDRVLVAGQTAGTQNGVYIVAAGAWTRATDSDTDAELRGFQYLITAGTQINAKYRNSNQTAITIGTTAITYVISQGAETDPIFSASPAFGITAQNITNWNAVHASWGALVPTAWWDSQLATKTTDNLAEGTSNLYYTNTRARAAISSAATGLNYDNATGVFSLASGRVIPTTAELAALQPLDADLTAIAALSATGTLRRTAANTWQLYTPAIADITGLQTALDDKQPLDSDLTAIAALSTNGLLRKTAGVWGMDASAYLTANQTITISGDASGSGTTAITLSLANSGVTAGAYGANNSIPRLTVDTKGRVTSATTITPSGTWGISVSGSSNLLAGVDNREVTPSEISTRRMEFGFGSWANDNTFMYADYIHLNSWQDVSGGAQNLLMFRKTGGLGMRLYQGAFAAMTPYTTFKDIAWTDGTNATGTWGINISGVAPWANISGKPTTLAGYGITDAQPLNPNLTAIAALNTNGLLRRSSGVWGIDTATYLTTQAAALAYQPLDADLTAIAALSATGTLRRTAANTWQLYTPAIADISGLSSALAAKQDLNSRLTALTNMAGTGVVQWNGTAFSAGNIAITQVTDLASTIDTLWILRDRDTVGPIDGVRQVRSIDYYQARMDFGFDKTLDVPYIFYDTGTKFLANYMNDDGVWFHVDQNGVQKRYLREGETTATVPTLQEVSQAGSNSSIRLKFNGINYALETAVPNLQSVAAAGSNSSIRLSLNGVGYATLAEIGGGGGSVGTLGQVLAQGNNTNGIDINLNGFGVIRTQQVGGQNEILIGNNANIQLAAVNTIRTNATNVFTNANIISNVAAAEFNTAIQGTNYESIRLFSQGISAGTPVTSLNLFANFVDISGPTDPGSALGGAVVLRLRGTLLELGVNASSSVVVRPSSITIGANASGNVRFNFHPSSFVNGQKYTVQYSSLDNSFNMVPA